MSEDRRKASYTDRPLTEEEREFATVNHNQLFSYMRGRRLDPEKWYDILVIPYLNAVKKYHEYEHLQIYGFPSILKRILDTAVNHHFRSERTEKRMPEGGFVSLDYTMEGDNPFSEHQVEARLIDHKSNIEKQIVFKEKFKEFYNKCIACEVDADGWCAWEDGINGYLKTELDLLIEGYSIFQVNKRTERVYPHGYTKEDVVSDMKEFRRIFKEVFGV